MRATPWRVMNSVRAKSLSEILHDPGLVQKSLISRANEIRSTDADRCETSQIQETTPPRGQEATATRSAAARLWQHRGLGAQDPAAATKYQPARRRGRQRGGRRTRSRGAAGPAVCYAKREEEEDQGDQLPQVYVDTLLECTPRRVFVLPQSVIIISKTAAA